MDNRIQSGETKGPPQRQTGMVAAAGPSSSRDAQLKREEPTNLKPWIIAAVLLLLLLGGLGAYFYAAPDPQVEKVKQLGQELFNPETRNKSSEERRQKFKEFREEYEKLTPEQKQKLREEQREKWRQRENERLKKYFQMSPEEKTKYLNEQIDQAEARREQFEERRKQWAEQREKRKQEAAARGETSTENNTNNRGPGRWAKMTPEERQNRMKARLDNSTADECAQRWQYRQDMKAQREARGLPAMGGFGGGGFGPGGFRGGR